ncbi:MAG: hypothetical protein J6M60_02515 [Clostridia bacterium]|nr:hypothetical protein [Clostridia bacterium]
MKNNKKGITLVALVITIIILLILAGVTLTLVLGEDGLISRAVEAGYKSNFSEIQEKTMLYWTNCEQDDIINMQNRTVIEKLPIVGEANKSEFKDTLIAEIRTIKEDSNLDIDSLELYEIDKTKIKSNVSHKYIIDLSDLQIYDVEGENFRGKWHHTLLGLGVEGSGEVITINNKASTEVEIAYDGDIGWIKPDLTGFDKNHSKVVYYNTMDFADIKYIPIEEYITNGRKSNFTEEDKIYVLDGYNSDIWGNVQTNANGLESWWVWIPRYAYKVGTTSSQPPVDVVFIDMDNKPIGTRYEDKYTVNNDGTITINDETYIIHPAFTETERITVEDTVTVKKVKELQGIWMSKFDPSNTTNFNHTLSSGECYAPDMSGFDENNTYIEYFDIETNLFTEGPLIKDANLSTVNNDKRWYDYSNKVWANVKTSANGIEAWWVWIPRYAYTATPASQEMNVIFIDLKNKPYDKETYGNELREGMIVHPAFTKTNADGTKTELKGIWMSKFDPSIGTNADRKANSGNCYAPDMSGFDENNTYIEYFDVETNTFTEGPALKDADLNTANENNEWYDYSNKVWANVKTNANNLEAWWVWIPRFAYSVSQASQEIDVLFIDLENKPYDKETYGDSLKEGMIVHPAFTKTNEDGTTTELKGIWMSKFDPSWVNT